MAFYACRREGLGVLDRWCLKTLRSIRGQQIGLCRLVLEGKGHMEAVYNYCTHGLWSYPLFVPPRLCNPICSNYRDLDSMVTLR